MDIETKIALGFLFTFVAGLCKHDDGSWDVMTNDQYKASVKLKKLEK